MRAIRIRQAQTSTQMRTGRDRTRRAYTALELIIVLAILGILAVMSIPKANVAQFRVDSGARLVRSVLQRAQRLAITRQFDVIVSFDVWKNRVRLVEDVNNNSRVDAGERVVWRSLEDSVHFAIPPRGINGSATAPVVGSSLKTIDGMPSIIFRRDGAASTDLEAYLTSKRALGSDYRGVQVVQSTGRTDWFRYLRAAWKQASL